MTFLLKQSISDYEQATEVKMDMDGQEQERTLVNKSFRNNFNEVALDLANFFFQRSFCIKYENILILLSTI